jgi:hypothetical protein
MTLQVAFRSEVEIEEAAQDLLNSYYRRNGIIKPPIEIEEILSYLGLSLDLDNLSKVFGVPDALGALCVETRSVYIDESLDPVEHPATEGRYRFTIGHEVGHWQLHRQYLGVSRRTPRRRSPKETHFCSFRLTHTKNRRCRGAATMAGDIIHAQRAV